ncbi:MAG: hypothetical protein RH948_19355 [Cyclobacteriaceae bacterium]
MRALKIISASKMHRFLNRRAIIILSLFWSWTATAQEFGYEVDLLPVKESGFHKIQLTPAVLGKVDGILSDLRIYDLAGVEQPYLIEKEAFKETNTAFKEYEIIERFDEANDSSSFFIFANSSGQPIDNISFIVQNTAVKKTAVLSGSNDQEKWYVIGNNYPLQSMYNRDGATFKKRLDFPLSDFQFFKLEVKGKPNEPINILTIGYHESNSTRGRNSGFDFIIDKQEEIDDVSMITLSLSEIKYFEKLTFTLTGARFYTRNARVYIDELTENRKKEKILVKRQIASIALNSNTNNTFEIGPTRVEKLYIEIDNLDNQPLIVENVSGAYLNQYLVTDLKAGEAYKMKFGNRALDAPSYDLAHFKRQLPNEIKEVELQQVRQLISDANQEPEKSLFENTYFIWSIIGVIGLFLLIISIRMIKELGHDK